MTHLIAAGPSGLAILGRDFEPVGFAAQDAHLGTAIDHVKYRISGAGARVDFDKRICQRNKLAVWFAFRGESRARLTYRKICTDSSREYRQIMTRLCEEVILEGGYGVCARDVATGLLAIDEGLWLDLLLTPAEMSPGQALDISLSYLRAVFPRHFSK